MIASYHEADSEKDMSIKKEKITEIEEYLSKQNPKKNLSEEEILNIKLEIVAFLRYCVDLFGDDFYIEIAAADSKDQKVFNQRIKSIAESQGIKIVIGSDAHYLTANERELHKAYLNSKEGEREVDNFYYFAHMMDNEEAYGYISDIYSEEDFKEFCENSMEIYNKIEGDDIFRNPIIPEVKVIPKECPVSLEWVEKYTYPVLYNLVISNNVQEKYWVSECLNALVNKNLWNGKYLERLEIEAKVIKTIGVLNIIDSTDVLSVTEDTICDIYNEPETIDVLLYLTKKKIIQKTW